MARLKVGQVNTANILGTVSTGRSTGTTTTVSHTVDSNDANLPITGITFNSVALTKGKEQAHGTNDTCASIWYLLSPTVTTANVVVTATGSTEKLVAAINLDGVVAQAPEAIAGASATASTVSTSITTLSDYAIVLDCASHQGANSTIGANQTLVTTVTNQSFEHNTTTRYAPSSAGSATMIQTWGSSAPYSHALVAFAPTVNVIPRTTVSANARGTAGTRTVATI
jgi:hypothetical protein